MSATRTRTRSTRERSRSPAAFDHPPRVVFRYERYQDTIKVNTIELETPKVPNSGLAHWQLLMKKAGADTSPTLDQIDHSMSLKDLQDELSNISTTPPDEPSPWASRGPPSVPFPPDSYDLPIYAGTTHNPAVFLAILRIAQTHLPHTNLVSALNHIPNLDPREPLPTPYPSAPGNLAIQPFLDYGGRPVRFSDVEVGVAFLPYFYSTPPTANSFSAASSHNDIEKDKDNDNDDFNQEDSEVLAEHDMEQSRHAIGFFHTHEHTPSNSTLGTLFFTPCNEADLRRWALVEYLPGKEACGVEGMTSVGCIEGSWLEPDVVEEYAEWKRVLRVTSAGWERRIKLARGAREA